MSLRQSELLQVVNELWPQLEAAVVQQASAHRPGRATLALRKPGETVILNLCAEPKLGRLSVLDAMPKGALGQPLPWQQLMRKLLVGARLTRVAVTDAGVEVGLIKEPHAWTLHLELGASAVLLESNGRVLGASAVGKSRLHAGQPFTPPETKLGQGTSRLTPLEGKWGFARAAESLLEQSENEQSVRDVAAPLKSKLARLERTIGKVRQDLARAGTADRHRRDGELLKVNLHRVQRGAKALVLDEYLEDGTIQPRTLTLDPARSPKQEAEWHFHQYRRLTRGLTLAQERLDKLEHERDALKRQLTEVTPSALPPVTAQPKPLDGSLPYREYQGHGGVIWVGRGAQHNDTLTFKVARPFHLWLHARGVPGAHVVVPIEKGKDVPQELLLDAAHLAVHHSDAKHEPKAEVSHVPVKFVRKVPGVPGAVTFTREKTFVLRKEPDRLARLLESERTRG